MTKLLRILPILFCVLVINLQSQVNFSWAKAFQGPNNFDAGHAIVTDAQGNNYTTGSFVGTVDFDPGAGTFTLTAITPFDIFVTKLDASGNLVWAKQFAGTGGAGNWGQGIRLDASGNVLITGFFDGTVDFDPGSSTANLTSFGLLDVFVCKLNSSGNYIWAKQLGGTNNQEGMGISTDAAGNVYTTGYFTGLADFDPGSGTFNMNSGSSQGIFVSKLDASGNFVWADQISGGSGSGYGRAIVLDAANNVYITGSYNGTPDFDPGSGVFNMTNSGGDDIFVEKLDASGNFVWAVSMGGTGQESGYSIVLDPTGNIYTTGNFTGGSVDMDPGAGTFILSSSGSGIYVSKLTNSGGFLWAGSMNGASPNNTGYGIALDGAGNIYTTGYFEQSVDFDPGSGITLLFSAGGSDIFVQKMDPSMNFVWAKAWGSNASQLEAGKGISIDNEGSILTTGFFEGTADFDPTSVIFNITSLGGEDVFVHKMCQVPATPLALSGPTAVCEGSILTYSVAPVFGATSYMWNVPAWQGTSITNVITVTVTNQAGQIKVSAINACGTSFPLQVPITILTKSLNAGPDYSLSCNQQQLINAVCSPTNPTSVSWSPTVGLSSSTVLTPTVVSQNSPTQYIVTVNLNNGCVVKDTVVISPFIITPSICIVTADSANKYNEVYWDKAIYPSLDSMVIFREVTNNVYKKIGAISRKALSYFIDTTRSVGPANGDPNLTTYRYKIQVRDTCGRYGPKSLWHNTVYFTRTGSTFQWNLYLMEGNINPVQTYSLMVCMNPTISTTYTLVGTAAGTQFSLNDPNYNAYQNTADWRVFADLGYVCTPSFMAVKQNINTLTQGGPISKSSSNIQNNRPQIGIKENNSGKAGIKIYPNPNHGEITIRLSNLMENTSVEIYNSLGQMVYKEKINSTSSILNLSKLANGIYQLRVLENNNLVKQEKIVKE